MRGLTEAAVLDKKGTMLARTGWYSHWASRTSARTRCDGRSRVKS